MNILCCLDDNFVQHTGVMLTSLFENNSGEAIDVYVMTEGLQEKNRSALSSIVRKYNARIYFYMLKADMLKNFSLKTDDYVSVAAYFRLLVTTVLPAELDKIIYIDGDTIVRSSLKELWETEIENYALAAIDETIAGNCRRHQYDRSFGYFNSGVMLLNLKYWREKNVAERAIDYLTRYPERIKSWDQDALNGVLYDKEWKRLPLKWNLTTLFLDKGFSANPNYSDVYASEYFSAIKDPAIVHYTGPAKPWHYTSTDHPFKKEYNKYLQLTVWKDYCPRRKMSVFCKRVAKQILSFFHCYSSPYHPVCGK